MGVTIYSFYDPSEEHAQYFPTKRAALKEARWWAQNSTRGETIEVVKHEVVEKSAREYACMLLSGCGWSHESETIATFRGIKEDD